MNIIKRKKDILATFRVLVEVQKKIKTCRVRPVAKKKLAKDSFVRKLLVRKEVIVSVNVLFSFTHFYH